jgi:hypothetical protein
MSMSINTVARGGSSGFDPSKMASMMASKMMGDLDPSNTGKVSKDQFVSGLTTKGVSSADATKMYDAIDTNKTGSIGKSDIEAAIKNRSLKPPTGGPQGGQEGGSAGGTKRAGEPSQAGKSGGGAPSSAGGASGSSTTYDAADTNKDGTVSDQEAAVYSIKHPSISSSDTSKTDQSKLGNNVDKFV